MPPPFSALRFALAHPLRSEEDPAMRKALTDVLHTSLRQCGALGLAGTLLYVALSVGGLGYDLQWTYDALKTAAGGHVVVMGGLVVAALSTIGLILSEMRCDLQVGRLFGAGAVLVTTLVATFEGALRDAYATAYVVPLYLVVVAIIPFRPSQVFCLGGFVAAIVYGLGPSGLAWSGMLSLPPEMAMHLTFLGGSTVLITAVSGVLYRRHRAFGKAQARLRTSRERLERVQSVAQVGGWDYDPEADTTTGTELFYRLLGLPVGANLTLKESLAAFPPEAQDELQAAVKRCLRTREPFDLEVPLGPDAQNAPQWVRVQGELREEENRRCLVGTLQDVTSRKRREEELQRAKGEAEEMSRLKTALLNNMSHEIRTPLTSILGFAEAIENLSTSGSFSSATASVAEFARNIQDSGARLLDTLDTVLDLSKLEAGSMEMVETAVDLTAAAEEEVEAAEPEAADAEVTLHTDLPTSAVRAAADPKALRRIQRSLLSNALKYTESGGDVWVRARTEGSAAVLEVEDTGIGMDPEQVDTLLEPFRQASEGVGRTHEGVGIGLAVVDRFVEQMGGQIDVATEPGTGTRVTVRLPRTDATSSSRADK